MKELLESLRENTINKMRATVSSWKNHAQQCVHPTGGSLRVFKPFSWLEVGSVKAALPRPTPSD
jgi:hypothetical protein